MYVIEIPGQAVGKKAPRSFRKGDFIGHYPDKEGQVFENKVALFAKAVVPEPLEGPVGLSLRVTMVPPLSMSGRQRRAALANQFPPTVKPDLSNVLKAIEDGLQGIGFADDRQVVWVTMFKRYGEAPSVRVVLSTWAEMHPEGDVEPAQFRVAAQTGVGLALPGLA